MPLNFVYCRVLSLKINIYGTWTVAILSTWQGIKPSLSIFSSSKKIMWLMETIIKGKFWKRNHWWQEHLLHSWCAILEGLKHSLLSISQLFDKGYQVTFKPNICDEFSVVNWGQDVAFGKECTGWDSNPSLIYYIFLLILEAILHWLGLEPKPQIMLQANCSSQDSNPSLSSDPRKHWPLDQTSSLVILSFLLYLYILI